MTLDKPVDSLPSAEEALASFKNENGSWTKEVDLQVTDDVLLLADPTDSKHNRIVDEIPVASLTTVACIANDDDFGDVLVLLTTSKKRPFAHLFQVALHGLHLRICTFPPHCTPILQCVPLNVSYIEEETNSRATKKFPASYQASLIAHRLVRNIDVSRAKREREGPVMKKAPSKGFLNIFGFVHGSSGEFHPTTHLKGPPSLLSRALSLSPSSLHSRKSSSTTVDAVSSDTASVASVEDKTDEDREREGRRIYRENSRHLQGQITDIEDFVLNRVRMITDFNRRRQLNQAKSKKRMSRADMGWEWERERERELERERERERERDMDGEASDTADRTSQPSSSACNRNGTHRHGSGAI